MYTRRENPVYPLLTKEDIEKWNTTKNYRRLVTVMDKLKSWDYSILADYPVATNAFIAHNDIDKEDDVEDMSISDMHVLLDLGLLRDTSNNALVISYWCAFYKNYDISTIKKWYTELWNSNNREATEIEWIRDNLRLNIEDFCAEVKICLQTYYNAIKWDYLPNKVKKYIISEDYYRKI